MQQTLVYTFHVLTQKQIQVYTTIIHCYVAAYYLLAAFFSASSVTPNLNDTFTP